MVGSSLITLCKLEKVLKKDYLFQKLSCSTELELELEMSTKFDSCKLMLV